MELPPSFDKLLNHLEDVELTTVHGRITEIIGMLIEKEREFWARVLEQVPPPADGSESSREIMKKLYPCMVCEKRYAEIEQAEVCERRHDEPDDRDEAYERAAARDRNDDFSRTGWKDWR